MADKDFTFTLRDPETLEEFDLRFRVRTDVFNRFVNSMGKDKISPANNFLFDCCHPDDKDTLRSYLKDDDGELAMGAGVILAGELVEKCMPKTVISLKKPETGQKPTKLAS